MADRAGLSVEKSVIGSARKRVSMERSWLTKGLEIEVHWRLPGQPANDDRSTCACTRSEGITSALCEFPMGLFALSII
jgi:hypothetical protein